MKILLAGATGFIGKALVEQLSADDHQISVLGRSKLKIQKLFCNNILAIDWDDFLGLSNEEFNQFELIINMTGAGIADRPWTNARKQEIRSSRIESTKTIVEKINHSHKKHFLINFSALGIYQSDNEAKNINSYEHIESEEIHEKNFLSSLVQDWEFEANKVKVSNSRLIILRLSIVLDRSGGILKKLIPPTSLGLGAQLGNGEQPFPWVTLHDLIKLIRHIIKNQSKIDGVFNVCSSDKINQKGFNKILNNVLHRPSLIRIPSPILLFFLGDYAKFLLISGQNASNHKLINKGFCFDYNSLDFALQESIS